MRNYILHLL